MEEYKATHSVRHCIAPVIEELAQGSRCARATRLFPIDGVQGLVDEKGDCTEDTDPLWQLLLERRVVREHHDDCDRIADQAKKCDQVRSDPLQLRGHSQRGKRA